MRNAVSAVKPHNPSSEGPKHRVEALAKGLKVLGLFSTSRPSMRVTDIAREAGYPMPTTFRLVTTLEQEGFLERTPDGSVRPGTGVLALGFAALQGLDLLQTSAVELDHLAKATGGTVNLGVLTGDQVLVVARVQAYPTALASNIRVGSTVPAVFSSIGKVLLAFLSDDEFAKTISRSSFAGNWGPKAVQSIPLLRAQLATVRVDDFIVQEEEAIPGLSSVAGPIRDASGELVAGLNVAVAAGLYDRERLLAEICGPVVESCRVISTRLGWG